MISFWAQNISDRASYGSICLFSLFPSFIAFIRDLNGIGVISTSIPKFFFHSCWKYAAYFSRVTYANSQKITGMTRSGFQEFDFADGAKIAK